MNSKFITTHHDGFGLNESIEIEACDISNAAAHLYTFRINDEPKASIQFQKGPRNEPGSTPGVTTSAVLAALISHFQDFQNSPFACRENAIVLTKLEEAAHWVEHRAKARAARGVLGKNET